MAREFRPVLQKRAQHDALPLVVRRIVEPQEEDTCTQHSEPKNQLPEVLVVRDENRATLIRLPQYFAIHDTWRQLRDVDHVVTGGAQGGDEQPVDVLIAYEIHAAVG